MGEDGEVFTSGMKVTVCVEGRTDAETNMWSAMW